MLKPILFAVISHSEERTLNVQFRKHLYDPQLHMEDFPGT